MEFYFICLGILVLIVIGIILKILAATSFIWGILKVILIIGVIIFVIALISSIFCK